jgi:hypothetical protein
VPTAISARLRSSLGVKFVAFNAQHRELTTLSQRHRSPGVRRNERRTKPFSWFDEVIRKQTSARINHLRRRDAPMLVVILNAIYHQFLRAALPGIARQGGKL